MIWFGEHVCGQECDGPAGCMAGKSEQGRFKRIQRAKEMCMACDVRIACLEFALETNQDFGVWGGKTERERNAIRKARREASGN